MKTYTIKFRNGQWIKETTSKAYKDIIFNLCSRVLQSEEDIISIEVEL